LKLTWSEKFNEAKKDFEKRKLKCEEDKPEIYARQFLPIWIEVAEELDKENKKLKKDNQELNKELDDLREKISLADSNVVGLYKALIKAKSFHSPGSGRKLSKQTIKAILRAYDKGEVSEFLKNNKTSRGTFYNVVGRKYKNEDYNREIEKIALSLDIELPRRS